MKKGKYLLFFYFVCCSFYAGAGPVETRYSEDPELNGEALEDRQHPCLEKYGFSDVESLTSLEQRIVSNCLIEEAIDLAARLCENWPNWSGCIGKTGSNEVGEVDNNSIGAGGAKESKRTRLIPEPDNADGPKVGVIAAQWCKKRPKWPGCEPFELKLIDEN